MHTQIATVTVCTHIFVIIWKTKKVSEGEELSEWECVAEWETVLEPKLTGSSSHTTAKRTFGVHHIVFELCMMEKKKGKRKRKEWTKERIETKLKFSTLVFSTLKEVSGTYGVDLAKGWGLYAFGIRLLWFSWSLFYTLCTDSHFEPASFLNKKYHCTSWLMKALTFTLFVKSISSYSDIDWL